VIAGSKPTGGAAATSLLLFGICPLLVASTTLLSGVVMGAAAAFVLCASAASLAICRRFVPAAAPLVFLLILTAFWTSILDLVLQSWMFPMRQGLGIYLPLIAGNCLVLAVLEEEVLGEGTGRALARVGRTGGGILLCVAAVGAVREFAATGSLLGDAALLGFEPPAHGVAGLAIMRSSTGAFLALALLAASAQAFRRRGGPV